MENTCFDNIVGLANAACPCAEADAPVGWDTSSSGLFIADLSPLDALSFDDCNGAANAWAMLARARSQAVDTFVSDLNTLLSKTNAPVLNRYHGWIGQPSGRDVVALSKNHAGLRVHCGGAPHGKLTLEEISATFDASGAVPVSVYDRDNNLVAGPYVINAVGGSPTSHAIPGGLVLPMLTGFGEQQEYFLVYPRTANLPRATKVSCGCGGAEPEFRLPARFPAGKTGPSAWTGWLMAGGWQGDSLTEFDNDSNVANAQKTTNGLAIKVRLECDNSRLVCDGEWDPSSPMAKVAAYAVLYKAASIAAGDILASPELSRQKIVGADALRERRREWGAEYAQRVEYIAVNADPGVGGCLKCRPAMSVAGIYT